MDSEVVAGPSPWAVSRFGAAVATHLWWEVPAALDAAVNRAVNARQASRMTTDHAFGNARWPARRGLRTRVAAERQAAASLGATRRPRRS